MAQPLAILALSLTFLGAAGCMHTAVSPVGGGEGGRVLLTKGLGVWKRLEVGGRTSVGVGWTDSLVVELPSDCRLVVVLRSKAEAERIVPILRSLQQGGGLCVIPQGANDAVVSPQSP